jgi:signal transduction histidine kinase
LIEHAPLAWPLWSALMVLALGMGLACMGAALMRSTLAWRVGLSAGALLAAVAWLTSRLGWPNAVVQPDGSVWLALVCAAFGAVMLGVVIWRFSVASLQARELLRTLEARVKQREDELAQSYAKLDQISRAQAQSEERTRILRDMHDGVGSHISAAIRQVEYGQVEHGHGEQQELLQTLRDSLDQLKLSIDAMHLQAGDVTALLANMRYRLGPRLKSSGIELQWAVQMLSVQPQLDHAALRQLQFMLFEAFSNVLQHSGASQLQLSAVEFDGRMVIALTDNGRGFDPSQPSRGLASMRERAKAIGADVTIHSRSGQTVVEIAIVSAHNASA